MDLPTLPSRDIDRPIDLMVRGSLPLAGRLTVRVHGEPDAAGKRAVEIYERSLHSPHTPGSPGFGRLFTVKNLATPKKTSPCKMPLKPLQHQHATRSLDLPAVELPSPPRVDNLFLPAIPAPSPPKQFVVVDMRRQNGRIWRHNRWRQILRIAEWEVTHDPWDLPPDVRGPWDAPFNADCERAVALGEAVTYL